ncbi:hypothetical protein HAX54_039171 [Datura stramonium]|uniref:Uncharacterized protein n=1 Tax=Datura stramonium TaxID=4076 RepID=A0ABS8VLI8_DATST|nr:hypothetical protein [Datura stramonium]
MTRLALTSPSYEFPTSRQSSEPSFPLPTEDWAPVALSRALDLNAVSSGSFKVTQSGKHETLTFVRIVPFGYGVNMESLGASRCEQ